MIYVAVAIWLMTAVTVRIRRGLTWRQALYLLIIITCAALTLRAVLFALGM